MTLHNIHKLSTKKKMHDKLNLYSHKFLFFPVCAILYIHTIYNTDKMCVLWIKINLSIYTSRKSSLILCIYINLIFTANRREREKTQHLNYEFWFWTFSNCSHTSWASALNIKTMWKNCIIAQLLRPWNTQSFDFVQNCSRLSRFVATWWPFYILIVLCPRCHPKRGGGGGGKTVWTFVL